MATMISTKNVQSRIILDGGFEAVLIATKNMVNSVLPPELVNRLVSVVGSEHYQNGRIVIPAKLYRELYGSIEGVIADFEAHIEKARSKALFIQSIKSAFTWGNALKAIGYLLGAASAIAAVVLLVAAVASFFIYMAGAVIIVLAIIGFASTSTEDLAFGYAVWKIF